MNFDVEAIESLPKPDLDGILNGLVQVMPVEENEQRVPKEIDGNCVECGDQPATLYCEQCADDFCDVCFSHQHRKGSRQRHIVKKFAEAEPVVEVKGLKATIMRVFQKDESEADVEMADSEVSAADFVRQMPQTSNSTSFVERAKFIPLRLTYDERKFLRLLEAALSVCEYTDKIDILSSTPKSKRIVKQIKELCSILSGLVLASDYNAGQQLFKDRDFELNSAFFQDVFELGRRHKIMNPEKMRGTYGKLVYLLQDSQIVEIQQMLNFKCVKPLKTVFALLEAAGKLKMLEDPLIEQATMEILDEGKSRRDVQSEIGKKERTIEYFAKKYGSREFSQDMIRQCLYSIGDNNAFLRTNRDPCERMIVYLKQYFDPKNAEKNFSLSIQSGRGGARLSHGIQHSYK